MPRAYLPLYAHAALAEARRGHAVDFRDYDTRIAAYALLVDARERVLLTLWNEAAEPLWTLPGGGVDFGETVAEAAVREVREETGYEIALGPVLGIDSFTVVEDRERPFKSVRVVFAAHVVGGELEHEVGGSTDEARWIPLVDVPALPRVPLVDVGIALRQAGRD
jgi:8-oxo-dGTP diphosphatase